MALSWADWFIILASGYGGILGLGIVVLIFYNRWNYRKIEEEREAEDEFFARLNGAEKVRGRVLSWNDPSLYGRSDGRRESATTMSDSTIGSLSFVPSESSRSVSEGVDTAPGTRGRRRESGVTMSTLEEEDMVYAKNGGRSEPNLATPQAPRNWKDDRRSPSLESRESWEA